MNDETLLPDLQRLAELYGINPSYWDATGTQHFLSERTLRQLLVGFGVLETTDATDQSIGQRVHAERQRLWRAGLPPVQVQRESEELSVELVVPEYQFQAQWRWSIDTEEGGRQEGSFTPAQLAISGDQHDVEGWANAHRTVMDDQELIRCRLTLPPLPCGYHTLNIAAADDAPDSDDALRQWTRLIIAPDRCYLPPGKEGSDSEPRLWGLAVQLYAVRSKRNWGIGDFTDLFNLVEAASSLEADVVGINPLHALFSDEPEQASPYSPASRLFLNALYIDVAKVDGFEALLASGLPSSGIPTTATLESLRSSEFVDYSAVVEAKLPVLEALFVVFTTEHLAVDSGRAEAFRSFLAEQGSSLHKFALFEALRETQVRTMRVGGGDWHQWPESLRHPDSEGVAAFAAANAKRINFHCWLQWLASEQLDAVAAEVLSRKIQVGLYRDLAVGVAGSSSDTWAHQDLFADKVDVGAPPDDFSANGQNWGLPPLNPRALHESAYSLFIETLRRNMSAAGALRIDHVMGLMRIFCIPSGETPVDGAYIDYPIDDLLAIIALESKRQSCIVIGEDLGTVPDGLAQKLKAAGVLTYRLMYFEKHYEGDQSFRRPEEYPAQALVAANTHDLPTLRSFWKASDLALRGTLDLFPREGMLEEQIEQRSIDRHLLLDALDAESILPPAAIAAYRDSGIIDDALVNAIHVYLARTRSLMLISNMEDLLGQEEQINLPGTDRDVYPNWRRKLPVALEQWQQHEPLRDCINAIRQER